MPPAPGGAPAAPPGGSPPPGAGAPPIGSSPATGPTQNLGATAQGNQIAGMVVQGLVLALTKIPPGTPLYQAVSKAQADISKHLEPGATSPQGISNAMKGMAMKHAQMAPHAGAMATQAGAPGGAPPPGGMPPRPPMLA